MRNQVKSKNCRERERERERESKVYTLTMCVLFGQLFTNVTLFSIFHCIDKRCLERTAKRPATSGLRLQTLYMRTHQTASVC